VGVLAVIARQHLASCTLQAAARAERRAGAVCVSMSTRALMLGVGEMSEMSENVGRVVGGDVVRENS